MAALTWYIFRKNRVVCHQGLQKDCFIPKFKLEYDDLENIKTDYVNTVVFNLHQIKRLKFFVGHPVLVLNIDILLINIDILFKNIDFLNILFEYLYTCFEY